MSKITIKKAIISNKPYKSYFFSFNPVDLNFLQEIGFISINFNTYNNNISLVSFGSYLTSNVGNGRFSKLYSDLIIIPKDKLEIIHGILLSDGYLSQPNRLKQGKIYNSNSILSIKQSLCNFGYLWYIFNELAYFCSSYPTFRAQTRFGKKLYSLEIQSRALPCFTQLHKLYYTT
jgi:hypothetical protein